MTGDLNALLRGVLLMLYLRTLPELALHFEVSTKSLRRAYYAYQSKRPQVKTSSGQNVPVQVKTSPALKLKSKRPQTKVKTSSRQNVLRLKSKRPRLIC